jgi:hypothetical protein
MKFELKMITLSFVVLPLALSAGCAGPGHSAREDIILKHFTRGEPVTTPYRIVQDKKTFYIIRDNLNQTAGEKPQVSRYRLYTGTFLGGASDNQANMIARIVAESHNLLDADLKTAADGISAAIRGLSSSADNKFLTLDSRISALESRLNELDSSIYASVDTTNTVSRETRKVLEEVLSLKNDLDGMPSEIVIFFLKGKHTLSGFEEERFVRFLDNLTHLARKRKVYFAISSGDSSLARKRTSSLSFTIDRYLASSPHEIKLSPEHDGRRDKDAIVVAAAFDPGQLQKPNKVNPAQEIKSTPNGKPSPLRGPQTKTNPTRNNTQSIPSIPSKEKEDKAPSGQKILKKSQQFIPMTSAPLTEKILYQADSIKPHNPSEEQSKRQGTVPMKNKNDDRDDPDIEELRQILLESGKMKR